MENRLAALSPQEFEKLVEQVIDRRMEVWLVQLLDALSSERAEGEATLQPEFADSLRQSIRQARAGSTIDLKSFREQLAHG